MATTFVKIATVTVGVGGSSTIDFTSIPQTYKDLQIVLSSRASNAAVQGNPVLRFNSSTSGYSGRRLYGSGTSATSDTISGTSAGSGTGILLGANSGNSATANVFGVSRVYIPNYTSSNNKTLTCDAASEDNAQLSYQHFDVGLWSNSAAITSITLLLYAAGSSFLQYSTATLYGIKSS